MSKDVLKLPFIPASDVERTIREIAMGASERVFILNHAKLRMEERQVSSRQVFNVLRNGEMTVSPKWDTTEQSGWKTRFSRITGGVKVTVIPKLVEQDGIQCLVVTVWSG